jgi:cbb3-type cytochrome oxidase maturation protein
MSPADFAVFATVIGSIVVFGTAAVLALGWAFRNGQFDNLQRGAQSIFGPDEPVGEATDAFPGEDANCLSVAGVSDPCPASQRPAPEQRLTETC